jgi:glycosyltransferase involved in cell wall biosynthesis
VLARGADATIATSRAVAARVPWAYPTVIYPAVDPWPHPGPNPSPASPLPLGEGRVRASPGQSEEAPIVGTAARLVPIKGLDVLVRAVATLPNARLEIAGDGPERARLERLARELGTADRITFLGWQDDLAECFARWTLASVASRDEGFGIAALEAMAAGLPVVASRVGGIPELVEHERSGLLVPPGDIAALANALGELTADPQRAAAMGAAARERAAAFRPERLVAAVAAVYERLL